MREINKKSITSIFISNGLKKINSFDFKKTIRIIMGTIIVNNDKKNEFKFLRL